ncbi:hypothetical protein QQ045_017075 [Rhodiola kirilowii]
MSSSTNPVIVPISVAASVLVTEHDDPLYVCKNEHVSNLIVTPLLTDAVYFITWKKSMEVTLGIKMKLGFVNGDFLRPMDPCQLAKWQRCNNVIFSWIINSVSKEIGAF